MDWIVGRLLEIQLGDFERAKNQKRALVRVALPVAKMGRYVDFSRLGVSLSLSLDSRLSTYRERKT